MKDERNYCRSLAMTVAAASMIAMPATAQNDIDTALSNWSYDRVYDGWRAQELLDEAEVFGSNGDEIGDVENILIDDQGKIVALVAEVGGFLDIGDTHVAVPWNQAQFTGEFQVRIPVTEDNVDDYSLFTDEFFTNADVGDIATVDDDFATGFPVWKATDLIDDYAVLETGEGFGYVDDLIFDDSGMLKAVIVNATESDYLDRGYYGYPWFGYGYDGYASDPDLGHYVLPYDASEISEFVTSFDYNEVDGGPF